jgi:hypothetical protein
VFDAEGCKEGLLHLAGYRKQWNAKGERWSDEPVKNPHTEGADAFRQWAQSRSKMEVVLYNERRPAPRGHFVDHSDVDDATGM